MNFKEEFLSILKESEYLLKRNGFPILEYSKEKKADSYDFTLEINIPTRENHSNFIIPKNLDKNFTCKLCANKLSAIKNFIHVGKVPILVLHYTGEIRKNQSAFAKTKSNLVFRNEDLEDLFDRLCKKALGLNMKDLFYQEYPACSFSPQNSSEDDWKNRIENCKVHIIETLEKYKIQSIILIGAAAVLHYGKEEVHNQTGKFQKIKFGKIECNSIVLRSPDGILALEEKRKKIKNKNSKEFELAKKEEDEVKKTTLEQFIEFKKQLGNI